MTVDEWYRSERLGSRRRGPPARDPQGTCFRDNSVEVWSPTISPGPDCYSRETPLHETRFVTAIAQISPGLSFRDFCALHHRQAFRDSGEASTWTTSRASDLRRLRSWVRMGGGCAA